MDTVDQIRSRNPEKLLFGIVVFLFLYSILRGIRFPNLWAASHLYFNYDLGFIKRGLYGTVIGWLNWDFLYTYSFYFYLFLVIFAANMVLLLDSTIKLVRSDDVFIKGAALVYASGFSLVFLAHTMGYADHIQLLAALIIIRIRSFRLKTVLAVPTAVILLLIHESFLLTFLPVVILSLILSHDEVGTRVKWQTAVFISVFLLLATWVINRQVLNQKEILEMFQTLQPRVDFPMRFDAFKTLNRSTEVNMGIMQAAWQKQQYIKHQVVSLVLTFPSVLYFLYAAVIRLQKRVSWTAFAVACSSLAPLSLHMFGWDVHRWNTLAVASSFLSLIVVTSSPLFKYEANPAGKEKWWAAGIAMIILVLSFSQQIPLFDDYAVKNFPFRSHFYYLSDVFKGEAPFPKMPPI